MSFDARIVLNTPIKNGNKSEKSEPMDDPNNIIDFKRKRDRMISEWYDKRLKELQSKGFKLTKIAALLDRKPEK